MYVNDNPNFRAYFPSFFFLKVDLEPQGKIHVVIELKWHGLCLHFLELKGFGKLSCFNQQIKSILRLLDQRLRMLFRLVVGNSRSGLVSIVDAELCDDESIR